MNDKIYPIFNSLVSKKEKEKLLNQMGVTIWFTGLSGSGKSTLGVMLENQLTQEGKLCTLLDGDNIRSGINNDLDFSPEGRRENIRRISEINKLFNATGVITINAFISPTKEIRSLAKTIIGKDRFIEIFVSTSLEECELRDTKGLYAMARKGEITNFTGINAPYEVPLNPDITVDTSKKTEEQCLDYIYTRIINKLSYNE